MNHHWEPYLGTNLKYCIMCGIMSPKAPEVCSAAKTYEMINNLIPAPKKKKKK